MGVVLTIVFTLAEAILTRGVRWNCSWRLIAGVLYASGHLPDAETASGAADRRAGLLSNGSNLLIFTAAGLTAGARPVVAPGVTPAGADGARRPGAAGPDPDGHRHRLRRPGLLPRAGAPRYSAPPASTTWTTSRAAAEGVMLLALPILLSRSRRPSRSRLLPLPAAAAARRRLRGRARHPGGRHRDSGPRAERRASRSCRSGRGRRPSASRWSPTCSARSWW